MICSSSLLCPRSCVTTLWLVCEPQGAEQSLPAAHRDPACCPQGLRTDIRSCPHCASLANNQVLSVTLMAQVRDHEIPGEDGSIPVRVYRPDSNGLLPIMVYYHGGGWVYGCVASHDSVCRAYANACNAVVVSVEYRLAPEHPFPAGLDDCYTAAAWVSPSCPLSAVCKGTLPDLAAVTFCIDIAVFSLLDFECCP